MTPELLVGALVDELLRVLEDELPDVPAGAREGVVTALCARCGGERHYLPRRPPGAAADAVRAAIAAGATIEEAAQAGAVSPRHARRLCGASSA